LSLEQIEEARGRLAPIIRPTPLMRSATLSRMLDADVRIKPENVQKTGSFKIRGAYYRIITLSDEEKSRGVVAASAGNHGQALAYAATRAGVSATIVMPASAAIAKIDATRSYGQSVILEGADYQAARAAASRICAERGAIFVDAYDDPYVVAGQGTVGLEIADEITPDVVMVPVGGGGLIAGIAAALAARAPEAEVIGVEAAGSPQLSASLAAGAPESIGRPADTIADGLATGRIGAVPFEIMRGRVKRVVTVDDFEIGEAVLLLLERLKLLAEGAGAAALAGALKLKNELKGKRVVLVLSGGNIDMNLLDRIIGHGLVKVGRLFRVGVDLRDRPGELGKLLGVLGGTGANVRAIDHDRTRRDVAIGGARVMLELETRGLEHIDSIRARLLSSGYVIREEGLGEK
jgi:threonine dehydratase